MMKLVGYVTVETTTGDRMVPFSIKPYVIETNNGLRHLAALLIADELRTATASGRHKLRAVSLVVERDNER